MFSQKVLSSVSTLVVKCLATSSPGSLSSSALLAKSTVGFLPPAASWSSVRGLHMSSKYDISKKYVFFGFHKISFLNYIFPSFRMGPLAIDICMYTAKMLDLIKYEV